MRILSIQGMPLERIEIARFLKLFFAELEKAGRKTRPSDRVMLKPFQDLIVSLNRNIPLPLLHDLAVLGTHGNAAAAGVTGNTAGIITRRINRCHYRLCRIQDELEQLDLKKAAPAISSGTAVEDYIFSQINFYRYREMDGEDFELLFPEGLADYDETFFKKNFGPGGKEIQTMIEKNYKKINGQYKLQQEHPLILSIMRTLETSLENLPLFTAREIGAELENLLQYTGTGGIQGAKLLYPLLVYSLDNTQITHKDGMATKLFISPQGDLSGTFRPRNKPWTRVLIKNEIILSG